MIDTPPPIHETTNYLNYRRGLLSWFASTDHKRIGVLYLLSTLAFFLVAVSLGVMIRLELFSPGMQYVTEKGYNIILTLHGVTMIFLFIIPTIPAVFGNFFLPILIGAKDMAFPRINLMSWYFYVAGGLLALGTILAGGVDTGWTFYVPFSGQTDRNIMLPMSAAFVLGWSSILTSFNIVVTVHRLRAPAMKWFQMPLFVWSLYATAWVIILATPVVGLTLVLVMLERYLGIPVFNPAMGGDPILYQHLFWIYSHPAVYIMILPAMGIASEIIPTFSRKPIFGYSFIVYSSLLIAAIGSLVWGHHMFTSGMSDQGRVVFSLLTYFVAVPSAVKVFNWVATLYKGSVLMEPPMLWAMAFVFLFTIGGLTGLMVASLAINIHVHDTSFIVAHFHYTMFGGAGAMIFGGFHYWFPKMFGRMYNFVAAKWALALFFIGFNLTYMPLFIMASPGTGLGMPRRYADYLPAYEPFHKASTIGSWIMVAGILLMVGNFLHALRRGARAGANPWGGATLEWRIPSPPPHENFTEPPDLSRGPYDYPVDVESPSVDVAPMQRERTHG